MYSSNFEKQDKTEIGLQLVTRVLLSLKICITRAILSLSGKTAVAKEMQSDIDWGIDSDITKHSLGIFLTTAADIPS